MYPCLLPALNEMTVTFFFVTAHSDLVQGCKLLCGKGRGGPGCPPQLESLQGPGTWQGCVIVGASLEAELGKVQVLSGVLVLPGVGVSVMQVTVPDLMWVPPPCEDLTLSFS